MRNKLILIMVIILLSVNCVTNFCFAEEKEIHNLSRYSYIRQISAQLNINRNVATCNGSASSQFSDTTTTVRVTLQRRSIGTTSWHYVCSWTNTSSGYQKAYIEENQAINNGYEYRVFTYCTIKDLLGNTLEGTGTYSSIVSCST